MTRFESFEDHMNHYYKSQGGYKAWEKVIRETEGMPPSIRQAKLVLKFAGPDGLGMSFAWVRKLLKRYEAEKNEAQV